MIRNYDKFLDAVESIREKTKRIEKYVPRIEYEASIENIKE